MSRTRFPRAHIALTLVCSCALRCNVFTELSDCSIDSDCASEERCHPDGHFCEVDHRDIVLGALLPLSGELSPSGKNVETGIRVAEESINRSGGVRGRRLRVDVLDDEGDPELAALQARALIDGHGAVGIVGPLFSAQAVAVQKVAHAAQIVEISPMAGSPLLSAGEPATDRFFFRTISTMRSGSGAAIALYARGRDLSPAVPRCSRMTIVYTDDATGEAYRAAVSELFQKLGGCVNAALEIPTVTQIDYKDVVSQIVLGGAECVHIAAYPEAVAAVLREYNGRALAAPIQWFGNTTAHSAATLAAAQKNPPEATPSDAEGLLGADIDSTPPTKAYADFRLLYNDILERGPHEEARSFASNGFDATTLLALAIERARSTRERIAIRDALWEVSGTGPEHRAYGPTQFGEAVGALRRSDAIHYVGASGTLRFDAFGTVTSPTMIWRVRDGKFEDEIVHFSEETIGALLEGPGTPSACE